MPGPVGARGRERRRQPGRGRHAASARTTSACRPHSSCSRTRRCWPCSPNRMPRSAPRSTPTPRRTRSDPTPCSGCTRTTSADRSTAAPLPAIPGLATAEDLAHFPPTLMINGEVDELRVSGEHFARTLAAAGRDIARAHRARHPARAPQPSRRTRGSGIHRSHRRRASPPSLPPRTAMHRRERTHAPPESVDSRRRDDTDLRTLPTEGSPS